MINYANSDVKEDLKNKVLVVGDYPKRYRISLDPRVKSGRILLEIINRNNLDHKILTMDLWKNEKEAKKGKLTDVAIMKLCEMERTCFIVGLGKYVHSCIQKEGMSCIYLPHPNSRKKSELFKLEQGLDDLCENMEIAT